MNAPASLLRSAAVFVAAVGFAEFLAAQEPVPDAAAAAPRLTAPELDQLLGPIALFPDPLLAQLLPAATYPLDIGAVARLLRAEATPELIEHEDCDAAIKALAHYPDLIEMLDSSLDWTKQLGCAFLLQPEDVLPSIQRLRLRAVALDNLVDSPEVLVLRDQDSILRVVPADPEVIFVPIYDPAVVYRWRPWRVGSFVRFSIGRATGTWFDLDCDWRSHCCYRPGWSWDHWRDNLVVDGGRVVLVKGAVALRPGELPKSAWRRDQTRPLPLPDRPLPQPSQFDSFRGREEAAPVAELEPLPPWDSDRGWPPESRHGTPFDPRQSSAQAGRNSQRGAQSRGGGQGHPAAPPAANPGGNRRGTAPPPATPPRAPGRPPSPDVVPAVPPPRAPVLPPPPDGVAAVPPQPAAHVPTPPVKVPPPPADAATPSRPALTGGGPAAERGAQSRGGK